MTESDLPLRQAVRALMIDPADRVLLVKLDLDFTDWVGWVLPGGGIEDGEDVETALRRELLEETGLKNAFIGPVVCHRRQVGPGIAQGYGGQEEVIHMVPCHHFELAPALPEQELRAEGIVAMQWFSVAELRASTESIVPGRLPDLVEQVLEFGGGVEPMVIDVVERSVRD